MEYIRIESVDNPLFQQMHALMGSIFPPEEVLEAPLWAEPLKDQGLRVYAAVHEGDVVGATEYRYYPDMRVARCLRILDIADWIFHMCILRGVRTAKRLRVLTSVSCRGMNRWRACRASSLRGFCARIMRL
jgi:hypothetical protein